MNTPQNIAIQLKNTLNSIHTSNKIVLKLKTLTPLYTGGVGCQGDQIHPSNLLGGIRHFSCLVARFLGEKDFEKEVWGTADPQKSRAKQIALQWDTSKLNPINLPKQIKIDNSKNRGWFFNSAFEGNLTLQISKRDKNIKEKFWNILLISIAIQIRYGMFGSKDQFGLGVLDLVDHQDFKKLFPKLNIPTNELNDDIIDEKNQSLNLKRYAFATINFRTAPGNKYTNFKNDTKLKLGLAMRYNLRNALRENDNDPKSERDKWKKLRHRMFGDMAEKLSSCVDISSAYGNDKNPQMRIVVELNLNDKDDRSLVFNKIRSQIANIDEFINKTGYKVVPPNNSNWEYGGSQKKENRITWLNKLAGVL